MHQSSEILDVYAREILDSRGNPTVEVEVLTEDGTVGRASVPSGASTGQYEAVELRDGGERYGGKGVQNAVDHVNTILADCIIGENIYQQAEIDRKLIRADVPRPCAFRYPCSMSLMEAATPGAPWIFRNLC